MFDLSFSLRLASNFRRSCSEDTNSWGDIFYLPHFVLIRNSMLEILAKRWSFYSFVGLVGLICWVGLPIGWEHRCNQDLQIWVVTNLVSEP